jgi:type I restriction enzyme S subunit
MGGEWRETVLGEVIELNRGYDLPAAQREPGSVPIVSSSGITDHHARAMARGPGVVTGRYGTLGEVYYIEEDFWPLNTTLYVRDFKGNHVRFISYFLRTLDFLAYSDKAAVPGLNRNHLHQAVVRIPADVVEQRAIANILGALDDKIELNRRMNETLEAMARALFKSWFVDFDPVRAKAEGRDPFLSPDLWALFPERLDEDEKPEGWLRLSLREVADVLSGGTPSKEHSEYWNGEIPWVSPKTMTGIHVSDSDERVTSVAIGQGTRLAPAGSVLVMVRGMGLHKGVRISQARRDVAFNQDVKALVPKAITGTHILFGLIEASSSLFTKVEAAGHGTGKIATEHLEEVEYVTARGPECDRLIDVLDALNDRIALSDGESMTLSALRDTLLPKLISGELRVKDAERIVEDAT